MNNMAHATIATDVVASGQTSGLAATVRLSVKNGIVGVFSSIAKLPLAFIVTSQPLPAGKR